MIKVYDSESLKIFGDADSVSYSSARSGNPKSTELSSTEPKSLQNLANCDVGSGHDIFLNGCRVWVDWCINKSMREQLLRYKFIDVVSSQSLMHKVLEFINKPKEHLFWKDVDDEIRLAFFVIMSAKNFESDVKKFEWIIANLPLGVRYWISFSCNYRQLKTLVSQRKNHKNQDWKEFLEGVKFLPKSEFIF